MNNYRNFFISMLLITVGVFNVTAFFVAESYTPNFWSAYGFTMVGFLLLVIYAFIALKNATSMRRAFFGLPVLYVGLVYFICQLVWGMIGILVPDISLPIYTVISVLLLGVGAVMVVMALIGGQAVQDIDDKVKIKTFFIKSLLAKAEGLPAKCSDTELTGEVKAVIEKIRFSDPMSVEALSELEEKIGEEFDQLQVAVESQSASTAKGHCAALIRFLDERGRMCKLLK